MTAFCYILILCCTYPITYTDVALAFLTEATKGYESAK